MIRSISAANGCPPFIDSSTQLWPRIAGTSLCNRYTPSGDAPATAAKVAAAEFDAADIDDLRRIPLVQPEDVPPTAAAATLLAEAELPLELSKEDIAPRLFEDLTPASQRQRALLIGALLLGALALGGIWWKLRSSRKSLPAVASAPASATPGYADTTPSA